MTLDEAIKRFNNNAEHERSHGSLQGCLEFRQLAEWLTELKELKEQTKPCEDCISRQEAINAIDRLYLDGESAQGFTADANEDCLIGKYKAIEILDELPSVQPEPKTGRWEFVQRGKFIDICCSECGYVRVKEYAYNYTIDKLDEREKRKFLAESHMNICECCGAKMIKSQESEE